MHKLNWVDGVIEDGEYGGSYLDPSTGIAVYWEHDGVNMYVGLVSPGTGWVGIGFAMRGMRKHGANIILGYIDTNGNLVLEDKFAVGVAHYSDVEQGGTDNILAKAGSEVDGKTIIEFVFPLNSGDPKDHAFTPGETYMFFLAFQESAKDFKTYHTARSNILELYVEAVGKVKPKATSLVITLAKFQDELVVVEAKITDETGNPVSNATLTFFAKTSFGKLKISSVVTDENGVSLVRFDWNVSGTLVIEVYFEGEELLLSSVNSTELIIPGTYGVHKVEVPLIVIWAYPLVITIVAVLVLSVFGTYGYVLYQLFKIRGEES